MLQIHQPDRELYYALNRALQLCKPSVDVSGYDLRDKVSIVAGK